MPRRLHRLYRPYDCVLLELPVSSGDELEAGGEVAMVMGTEGFTMGIAVDEQDISAVAVGQEVAFTVDAVDGNTFACGGHFIIISLSDGSGFSGADGSV